MIIIIKRVVVAGCRHYTDYQEAKNYIDFCISKIRKKYNLIVVSGGCKGADLIGEQYARENNLKIERYPAQWEIFGKKAGPKRNKQMAEIGDFIICFWDGKSRGTKSLIDYALEMNKPIKIKRI